MFQEVKSYFRMLDLLIIGGAYNEITIATIGAQMLSIMIHCVHCFRTVATRSIDGFSSYICHGGKLDPASRFLSGSSNEVVILNPDGSSSSADKDWHKFGSWFISDIFDVFDYE